MNKLLSLLVFVSVVMLTACGSQRSVTKNLSDNEKSILKTYRKNFRGKDDAYRVLVITNKGNMVLRLYNETPLHRDNFVNKVDSGFYNGLLFHRIIKDFMIQGGDPKSKAAKDGDVLGDGEAKGGRIPAEIRTDSGIYHQRGTLAAARDNNPEKASSNCQFYISQGKVYTEADLKQYIERRGLKLNDDQIKLYTTKGGIPHLDNNYTVFGITEEGIDVLDQLQQVKTGKSDRPETDEPMLLFVISKLKKK